MENTGLGSEIQRLIAEIKKEWTIWRARRRRRALYRKLGRAGNVHTMCQRCYSKSTKQRLPIPMPLPTCSSRRCCYCLRWDAEDIYVRDDEQHDCRCEALPRYRGDWEP